MRHPHLSSGGRYPVLRTLAILYLVGAVVLIVMGVWQAVNVFRGGDTLTNDLFGAPTNTSGKVMASASWLAATFIGALGMVAIAELIKLFIDIEHNTRTAASRTATAVATADVVAGDGVAAHDGPGVPIIGGRGAKLMEGDETAEGALLRGH